MPSNLNPDPWLPDAPCPLAWQAVQTSVYKITGTGLSMTLTPLPNIQLVAWQDQEGPDPGSAVFRYDFGSTADGAPHDAVQALSTAFMGTLIVNPGDRLVAQVTRLDGTTWWFADSWALNWDLGWEGDEEAVVIHCTGVAKRLWDIKCPGMLMRASGAPETINDIPTDLIAQFNPRGIANATPSTGDAGSGSTTYPTFLDPNVKGTDANGNPYPQAWTLPMAAAYLCYTQNKATTYVSNPSRTTLNNLLIAREPMTGVGFDPNNASTYTAKPINAADTPQNGKPWITLLHDLIKPYGFGMRFDISDDSGTPTTALTLFLRQAASPKSLYLQARGSNLDPGATNVSAANLSRELMDVANQFVVEGGLVRYEASFVLAPGFPSSGADSGSDGALKQWDSSDPAFTTPAQFDGYRLFVLDESGEGHYANASATKITTVTSMDAIFGPPKAGVAQYVARRRSPLGELFKMANGKRLRARLAISTNYGNAYPAVWDKTGTWQAVNGGWTLLQDRIGIRINIKHPNAWKIGAAASTFPFPSGIVKAVESIGAPSAKNPAFFLRLTCIVESDQAMEGKASRATTSALPQTIEVRVDARDRLQQWIRDNSSEFNATGADQTFANDPDTPKSLRDDTDLATAEATAARTATEAGVFDGEVPIPYITGYYLIGDRIDQVVGRGLPLRTDNGGAGYAPVLPMIVARRFDFLNQKTYLTLSDEGLDRTRRKTRPGAQERAVRAAAGKFTDKTAAHSAAGPNLMMGGGG